MKSQPRCLPKQASAGGVGQVGGLWQGKDCRLQAFLRQAVGQAVGKRCVQQKGFIHRAGQRSQGDDLRVLMGSSAQKRSRRRIMQPGFKTTSIGRVVDSIARI